LLEALPTGTLLEALPTGTLLDEAAVAAALLETATEYGTALDSEAGTEGAKASGKPIS
jgi:hypothetical protein